MNFGSTGPRFVGVSQLLGWWPMAPAIKVEPAMTAKVLDDDALTPS